MASDLSRAAPFATGAFLQALGKRSAWIALAVRRRELFFRRPDRAALILGAVLFLLPAGGPAAEDLTNPVLGDPVAIEEGRRLYRTRCVICHGRAGGRGPNLFATTLGDEAFMETVINGRGTMPALGLRMSPDEVWQVHAYVKSTDHYE